MSRITDEDGAFKIENLKPGTSRLSAKPKSQSQAQPKNVERTVTTYYPSIIDSTQAAWIQVQGIDLFGYDIRLQAAHATLTLLRPAYRRAVFVDGLVRSLEPRAQTGGRSETADDGSFEFPAVLEGDWTLRANLGSDNQRSGAAELRIGRDDLDKVVISLAGPFYVTASPDWGDSTPPVKPRLLTSVAILLPLDGQANGKIEIGKSPSRSAAFAGQYLISGTTSAESGFYLAAIMMDNRD